LVVVLLEDSPPISLVRDLNRRNLPDTILQVRSAQTPSSEATSRILENPIDAAEEMRISAQHRIQSFESAFAFELYLSALAGTTWYFSSSSIPWATQMGRYKFSSWTLHMASIIIFSTLWGIALKE